VWGGRREEIVKNKSPPTKKKNNPLEGGNRLHTQTGPSERPSQRKKRKKVSHQTVDTKEKDGKNIVLFEHDEGPGKFDERPVSPWGRGKSLNVSATQSQNTVWRSKRLGGKGQKSGKSKGSRGKGGMPWALKRGVEPDSSKKKMRGLTKMVGPEGHERGPSTRPKSNSHLKFSEQKGGVNQSACSCRREGRIRSPKQKLEGRQRRKMASRINRKGTTARPARRRKPTDKGKTDRTKSHPSGGGKRGQRKKRWEIVLVCVRGRRNTRKGETGGRSSWLHKKERVSVFPDSGKR